MASRKDMSQDPWKVSATIANMEHLAIVKKWYGVAFFTFSFHVSIYLLRDAFYGLYYII